MRRAQQSLRATTAPSKNTFCSCTLEKCFTCFRLFGFSHGCQYSSAGISLHLPVGRPDPRWVGGWILFKWGDLSAFGEMQKGDIELSVNVKQSKGIDAGFTLLEPALLVAVLAMFRYMWCPCNFPAFQEQPFAVSCWMFTQLCNSLCFLNPDTAFDSTDTANATVFTATSVRYHSEHRLNLMKLFHHSNWMCSCGVSLKRVFSD